MKQEIIKSLESNPLTQAIVNKSSNAGNLFPMEEALALASAFNAEKKNLIVVKKNRYEAQQLYERLNTLQDNVLLFVMEESLRVQAIASSPEDREQMLDALTRIARDDEPKIIITNVAGLTRYLPDVDFFKSLCFELKVGMEMDMSSLKQKLNRSGYAKVHYVDRPCTYAARGGIVDIFTLEYDHPIRIEFFDTEIDSIRFFDEQTQRTIKTVDSVTITPATDLLFDDEQIEAIANTLQKNLEKEVKNLSDEDREMLTDHVEADIRSLQSYDTEPHLYWYFSYIKSAKLTDYIDARVILSSKEEVESSFKQLNTDNIAFIQEMVQERKALPRYIMFHDLYEMENKLDMQYFHQFMSHENPIHAEIYPVERVSDNLGAWLYGLKEPVYLAVDEDGKKRIDEKGKFKHVTFIEPEFYEGFQIPGYTVYTDKELFKRTPKTLKYSKTFKEGQMLSNFMELEPGDYVVHGTYGIGQYTGIVTRKQNGKTLDYLRIIYKGGDELFVPLSQFQLVRKYISKEGAGIRLSQLGSNQWQKTKEKVSKKIEEIAGRLVDLYASRNENIGYAFPKDDVIEVEFDESFEFEPTPDQEQATREIKEEMEKPKPMDHLLCGDVGFGKTEVAMRCAFKAIAAGKQVAVLCPTTILSMQHFKTFSKRFEQTGARIALLNRFTHPAAAKQIIEELKDGKIDILIGTHRLFNKNIEYKDLGLLIIDEEQRFGVEHKEKIKEMKNSIDVLSLSATPIPRTLQMSLIGVRTISQLNTPPADRHPIQTYVLEKKPSVVEEVIQRELARDGQVFYLYNRVEDIYKVAKDLEAKFPHAGVAVAHGRMSREEIENTMVDFAEQKFHILVCTTIIETGLDIANANTIIIEDADHFGLSQLYQIRGRVGRREKLAYCYLMVRPDKELTEQANKRLKSIKEFTKLGSGYKIAMRDLTIRGAGDMLGPQQAGFIDQVGIDMYLEMLAEAIDRKQGKTIEKPKEMKTAQIQLDAHIPEVFTDNDGDKLSLYQDIKKAENEEQLRAYESRVEDLFGKIPKEVQALFKQRRLDLFVNQPGVESLKETGGNIVLLMDRSWSARVDGAKLFSKISKLSKTINLRLNEGKIQITIDAKKKNHMKLLSGVIVIIEELSSAMETENKDKK